MLSSYGPYWIKTPTILTAILSSGAAPGSSAALAEGLLLAMSSGVALGSSAALAEGLLIAPPVATYVIFYGDSTLNKNVIKYNLGTDATSMGALLQRFRDTPGAAGNYEKAWIVGGANSGFQTETYVYETEVSAGSVSLIQGTTSFHVSAIGNSTTAVHMGHYNLTDAARTGVYTYLTGTIVEGTNLGMPRARPVTWGTGVKGYATGSSYSGSGWDPIVPRTSTSIYEFATNILTAGTNLGYEVDQSAAASGPTHAMIGTGFNIASDSTDSMRSYTYATDVVALGTSLRAKRYGVGGAGNTTKGIFGGGYLRIDGGDYRSNVVDVYTYATNVVTPGTSLPENRVYPAATCTTPGSF